MYVTDNLQSPQLATHEGSCSNRVSGCDGGLGATGWGLRGSVPQATTVESWGGLVLGLGWGGVKERYPGSVFTFICIRIEDLCPWRALPVARMAGLLVHGVNNPEIMAPPKPLRINSSNSGLEYAKYSVIQMYNRIFI